MLRTGSQKERTLSTDAHITRLKTILQNDVTSRDFENLTAALLSRLLGVSIAVAKSGFQHGGDAGPVGRQNRRFRIETKRYADTTSFSDRELLGEVDHAVSRDPAIEAWFLTATRAVPEQLEQDLQRKSDELGLPIIVIDWKPDLFPALAALCTSAPDVLKAMVSDEAGDLAQRLAEEGKAALLSLRRDLESWNLGFESLRSKSHERLTTIWSIPRTSKAVLGQDAAGGHYPGTIRRQRSFAALSTWWAGSATKDAPAAVIGWEGVGKTWAALDWLIDRKADLPIVLVVPSSAIAGMTSVSGATIKEFISGCLYDLTEARDIKHWQMRFDRLLKRPLDEGPVLTLFFDGMNQEPFSRWLQLIQFFQAEPFTGRIRLILTTRKLHFTEKLLSLRGLIVAPDIITVETYDDSPGGELDQRLNAEGLSRNDLHDDLILLARTPRLFILVVRLRDRLVDVGQVTVHRLLWEYGRDFFGIRAGRSFSETEWRDWLNEVAQRYRSGTRDYNLRDLGNTAQRSDLTPEDVFRRMSDVIDTQFVTLKPTGRIELTPTLVAHALAFALVGDLVNRGGADRDAIERTLAEWFDPIDALDEKAEIIRAAVSIQLEQKTAQPVIVSGLVFEWLSSQNIPDRHRSELARIATPICDALLDAIERSADGTNNSVKLLAVNALRAVSRTDTITLVKIVDRATDWLRIVSRDVDSINRRDAASEKARANRFLMRIGLDTDGKRTVLGQPLVFVEHHYGVSDSTIPSLLEGFPLVPAMSVFKAAAINMAIRNREEYWDGLKWLCLFNDEDFGETAKMLRAKSDEIVALTPEPGVHPELSHRVAALMLWLSGDEDNEAAAAHLNPPLGRSFSYEQDYLSNPAMSFFSLERRHAEQTLNDKSIAIYGRIDRTKRFFSDPTFIPPLDFCTEFREYAATFNVSILDSSRSHTREDNAFESLSPVLARCAPDLLADLIHKKLVGFATRPSGQRLTSGAQAVKYLLLTDDKCATAARTLRLNYQEPNENDEAFCATNLLILEILEKDAQDQITAIINTDLKYIYDYLAHIIKPLSNKEADELVRHYAAKGGKQLSDLVLLLYESTSGFGEDTWKWLECLALDEEFLHRGVVFKMLNEVNPQRFGRMLMDADWRWQPQLDIFCNHYGSLALIAATSGLPFEQSISSIAPWLLLKAVVLRGGSLGDVQLAAVVLETVLCTSCMEMPDLGSEILVDIERRKIDPSIFSITVRSDGGDDPFAALRTAMDQEKRLAALHQAVDTAVNRVKAAQESGAHLFMHHFDASDFAPIIEHAPDAIAKWLEGANSATLDFKRRVRIAEGFYLALCEALLSSSPDQGATLWRVLHKTLVTRYLGRAQIDEMMHLLFRSANVPEALREEQLSLPQTNSDQKLFELAVVASINGERAWLDRVIATDLASGVVWRAQRANKITGFTTNNSLPIPGAWNEGPEENLHASRQRKTAYWRHKEGCAKYWWNVYWKTASDEEAYAAWVLFLEIADRRAYQWMTFQEGTINDTDPKTQRRLAHFYCNQNELKSAMSKQEKQLEGEFLGRKTINGIGPWGKVGG